MFFYNHVFIVKVIFHSTYRLRVMAWNHTLDEDRVLNVISCLLQPYKRRKGFYGTISSGNHFSLKIFAPFLLFFFMAKAQKLNNKVILSKFFALFFCCCFFFRTSSEVNNEIVNHELTKMN